MIGKLWGEWHHQLTLLHIHIDWSKNIYVSCKFAKLQSVITSLLMILMSRKWYFIMTKSNILYNIYYCGILVKVPVAVEAKLSACQCCHMLLHNVRVSKASELRQFSYIHISKMLSVLIKNIYVQLETGAIQDGPETKTKAERHTSHNMWMQ